MFPTNFSMQKRMSNFWAAVFGFLYIITACLITNFYYWNFLKTINLKYTFFSIFSWPLFCKEALPDRNFTFWEWFHRILLLTQQHLSKLWQKGTIHILRKHFFSTNLNLTSKFFTRTGFFRQNKGISCSTLHFDKILFLKFLVDKE